MKNAGTARPIALKLVLATVLFSSVITLTTTCIQLYVDYRQDLREIQAHFMLVEGSYIKTLSRSVWLYDTRQIEAQLEGLLKLPDMEHFAITAGKSYNWTKGKLTSAHVIIRHFPLVYRFRDVDHAIGTLTATASLDSVYKRLLEKALTILVTNAVRAFCVSGFILFVFQLLVTRHLVALARHVRAIDLNQEPALLKLKRREAPEKPDELAMVTDAINSMHENLHASYIALKNSEQEFAEIFNMSLDLICVADIQEARFIKVNPAFRETLGYSVEELTSRSFMDFVHPDDIEPTQQIIENALKKGQMVVGFENRYQCIDGSFRWLRWVSHPIPEQNRNYAVAHDITDMREMEETLRQAHKMQAVGTLAGGVAHEFNNILSIILGNIELAMEDTAEKEPVREFLEESRIASLRGRDVVQQLLSFSRKSPEERKKIDPVSVVRESLKLMRASLPAHIALEQAIADGVRQIEADPTQFHQIIMSLCTNAAHAIGDTEGIVRIEMQNKTLNAQDLQNNPDLPEGLYIEIRVTDNGCGMDPATLERIFEPYFTTKETGKGTGLGLAVVHGIIERHRGFISVSSRPAEGTTFRVYLPALPGD